ncbi:uncharacterized protein LOC117218636 [Megalopta genalis]|uniref:uncharacterized protein LOC117218636 n=1 Tax=Megalopta genalis TaxID=115081 RepID=UPI003FD4EB46
MNDVKKGLSSEDKSSEHLTQLRNKAERNSRGKLYNDSLCQRKRSTEETENKDHAEAIVLKKRYVLNIAYNRTRSSTILSPCGTARITGNRLRITKQVEKLLLL